MIPEANAVLLALLAVIAMLIGIAVRPDRAVVPAGWYINGVSPTGEYRAHQAPGPERSCARGVNGCAEDEPGHDAEVTGRIYCTGGARPIVVNERTVGCQR